MAKALLVKANNILAEKTVEEIRANILRQYHEGGVIVLDNLMKYEVIEFDAVQVSGSSPTGHSELFAVLGAKEYYVVRDEFGRIVVSDKLMRELIERAYGSSAKDFRETQMYKEMLAHVGGKSNE